MRSIAYEPTRAKMLYLCRDNIARFFKRHAERAGPMGEIVRRQWRETTLPVHTIRQATEPAPGADGGDGMAQALKGHALGGIPDASGASRLLKWPIPRARTAPLRLSRESS